MKVLVTGGAGLIGRNLCDLLDLKEHEVIALDTIAALKKFDPFLKDIDIVACDILYESQLRNVVRQFRPDVVYHLAAMLGVEYTETCPQRTYDVNVLGTVNVLNACIDFDVRHLIFSSSSEVYGEPVGNLINEHSHTRGKNVYSWSKLAGETIIKTRCMGAPLTYTIARLFNCYGPQQIAQFFLPKIVNQVLNNEPPIIYGDGRQLRGFCYVTDTTAALSNCMHFTECFNETVNIGNDATITLKEAADVLLQVVNKKKELLPVFLYDYENADRKKSREIFNRTADMTRMKEWLQYTPQVSLYKGLRNVIDAGFCPEFWP